MIAVPGDMRDPGAILGDDGLTALIDLAEPACVIMSGVLHFADPGTARQVAAAFARALAPGSYLIISVGSGNPAEGDNFTSAYTAAQIYIHPLDDIVSFFAGLDLVPPGVVPVRGLERGRRAAGSLAAHGDVPGRRCSQVLKRARPTGDKGRHHKYPGDGVSARMGSPSFYIGNRGPDSGPGPAVAAAALRAIRPGWGCYAFPGTIRMGVIEC